VSELPVPMRGKEGAAAPPTDVLSEKALRDPGGFVPTPGKSRSPGGKKRSKPKHPYRERFGVDRIGELALTPEEIRGLLDRVDVLSEKALLELAATTGIRREDLCAIPLANVNLDTGSVRFFESKKHREREVYLPPNTRVTIRTYVRTLPRGTVFLFPSPLSTRSKRKPLSGRYAYDVFHRWLAVSGISPRPFHALRATAYKLAKARGWSVEQAAGLIGDTVQVAMEVYGRTTPGELRQLVEEKPLL
jgi:integrase